MGSSQNQLPINRSNTNMLEAEYGNAKDRFGAEMRAMEDEMMRFRNNIIDSNGRPATGSSKGYLDGLNTPLIKEGPNGEKILKLRFDVSQFPPDNLSVKTVDNRLQITARHEGKASEHIVYREFNREFLLPKGTEPDKIKSTLSQDGVLTVDVLMPNASQESLKGAPSN